MTSGRWAHSKLVGALVAAAVLVTLVVVGRVESERAVSGQLAGIDRIRWMALATHKQPDAYRLTPTLDCLLYGIGINPYALELCYDHLGGLVEAIDRRSSTHSFWDIEYSPGAARVYLSPSRLSDTLRAMGAFKFIKEPPGGLPTYVQDYGPQLRGSPYPVPES